MTDAPEQPGSELPFISVEDIAKQAQWSGTISYEDPLDKAHRLEQAALESKHKRWRSTTLFAITLVGLGVLFMLCVAT